MGVSYFLFMAGKITTLPSSPAPLYQPSQLQAEEDLEMEIVSHGSDEALLEKGEFGSSDTISLAQNGNRDVELEFSPMHYPHQSKSYSP